MDVYGCDVAITKMDGFIPKFGWNMPLQYVGEYGRIETLPDTVENIEKEKPLLGAR